MQRCGYYVTQAKNKFAGFFDKNLRFPHEHSAKHRQPLPKGLASGQVSVLSIESVSAMFNKPAVRTGRVKWQLWPNFSRSNIVAQEATGLPAMTDMSSAIAAVQLPDDNRL